MDESTSLGIETGCHAWRHYVSFAFISSGNIQIWNRFDILEPSFKRFQRNSRATTCIIHSRDFKGTNSGPRRGFLNGDLKLFALCSCQFEWNMVIMGPPFLENLPMNTHVDVVDIHGNIGRFLLQPVLAILVPDEDAEPDG